MCRGYPCGSSSGYMVQPSHGFFFFFGLLGLHSWHMEVPRLGVKLELQLPAYTMATAMQDPSRICDLYHSSWQRGILNPLSEARDRTHILWILVRFVNY